MIHRDLGPVASWLGSTGETGARDTLDELLSLAECCRIAVGILHKQELLIPTSIELDGWFDVATQEANKRAAVTVAISSNSDVVAAVRDRVAAVSPTGRECASELKILGTGILFEADGKRSIHDDVVWLDGMLIGRYLMSFYTQSDAWLPYTLLGTSQPEVHALNAPRLEKALMEISDALNISLVPDRNNKLAIAEGFRVRNFTLDNGDILVPEKAHHTIDK